MTDLRSLDENKWLGFEEKLMDNFSKLLGIRILILRNVLSFVIEMPFLKNKK
jgi:hypothetical protein